MIYRLRRLAFPQICTGSVLWRFAAHSCTSDIEKATAHAEEGTRRLTRQAPSRGVRPATTPHGGFLHALPSHAPRNAAAHTSSALAHLRGAPHSASPNAAGGGEAAASFVLPASRAARRRALTPLYSPRGQRSRTYPRNSAFHFWSRSACSQTVCLFPVPHLAFRLCPARVNALAIFRKFVCYPVNNRAACKKNTVAFDIVELLFAGTFYTQHQLKTIQKIEYNPAYRGHTKIFCL